ncbi:MAG: glycoside hydrolase family 13 protein [Cyclobacteriaceae bacterium]|nr:glycoside hydrolase family 13 protein [Cyclobacteriaceae bacterium]UYN85432.1 MAG: glycoside hydrolase family 13 protein [Cyclobacteriaceae bacterium]
MKPSAPFLLFVLLSFFANAQNPEVYPPHWWSGMKNTSLQLMVHGTDIGKDNPTVTLKYPGVTLKKVHYPENNNYLFIDLDVSPKAAPGKFNLTINQKAKPAVIEYTLKPRRNGKGTEFAQGVTSSDFIYLLMPDRFSNGDPSNDRLPGMRDQSLNRDSIFHRHGGDLQGVINKLDYLQDLGITALWMTPVIQNDMPNRTEHGYAFTNHYKIEPRFGGEEAYKKLSYELHRRGMKLIQDAVYNHVGLYHFTVQDKPMKDWLHEWPEYTNTSYRDQTLFDPYVAPSEKKKMSDGWFTKMMPDLNHQNPFVEKFLIQHAIWSVEEFGVDGWRIDTYHYNDLEFMNRCNKALMDEYPSISMFGETWVHGVINQAYFVENNLNFSFKSNLPATNDFQTLFYGIQAALNEKFGWTEGASRLYQTMSNDLVYKDPMKQVIFLDNHDLSRFFSVVNEDLNKIKVGFTWLLTSRGIPQMYYGGEILMKGVANPDGWVRLDFPGGWPDDKVNKFTAEGRTKEEQEVFTLIRTLANFRKTSSALKTGKMMQYVPVDGLYVYFRYDNNQTVMCVMNTGEKEMMVDFSKYIERTAGFTNANNVLTGESIQISAPFKIKPVSMVVLELKK